MDVPLYAIALIVFSVLYLGVGVFLAFTLIITLIVMFLYLALRWGNVSENYPHGLGDSMITVIFIGVTWGIFTYLAPKNPIPFVGKGLTYTSTPVNLLPFAAISLVLIVVFLSIGAFIARDLRGAMGSGTVTSNVGGDNKPKQGVGA
jgi:hypothetical protein